jgi:hypothetical protein
MLLFFGFFAVIWITLHTRWQPIEITKKNIQHHGPNQHIMFRTSPEVSPFSLATTFKLNYIWNGSYSWLLVWIIMFLSQFQISNPHMNCLYGWRLQLQYYAYPKTFLIFFFHDSGSFKLIKLLYLLVPCCKVPLQVNFFNMTTFLIVFYQSNLSTLWSHGSFEDKEYSIVKEYTYRRGP